MFIVYYIPLDLIYRKITERITADEVKLKTWTYKTYMFCVTLSERWIPICCLLDQLAKFSKFYFWYLLYFEITQSRSGYS